MGFSTEANVLRKAAQVSLGGQWIRGLSEANFSENRDEALVQVLGSKESRVRSRVLNSGITLTASTIDVAEQVQRAFTGWDPIVNADGLMIDPDSRMDLPLGINILTDRQTSYRGSIYYGAATVQPVYAMSGAPGDEWMPTFNGITDRRGVQILGGYWLRYEKKELTESNDDWTATLTIGSVQPVGSDAYGIDCFVVVDPSSGYETTRPHYIAKVPAGATCFGSNGKAITILAAQWAQLPEALRDAVTAGATPYVLAVCADSTATASSDNTVLSVQNDTAWTVVA